MDVIPGTQHPNLRKYREKLKSYNSRNNDYITSKEKPDERMISYIPPLSLAAEGQKTVDDGIYKSIYQFKMTHKTVQSSKNQKKQVHGFHTSPPPIVVMKT